MDVRQLIRETIQKEFESVPGEQITKEYLIQRIPFLKEFRLADNIKQEGRYPRVIHFTKDQYNSNVTQNSPDLSHKITLSHLNFFSDFSYSIMYHQDKPVHHFNIKNEVLAIVQKDPQDPTGRSIMNSIIQMIVNKHTGENSAHFEIMDVDGNLSKQELDKAISGINGKMFAFGDYLQKHFSSSFIEV